jgi:plasmid rolling circle replication initiator protein Rep
LSDAGFRDLDERLQRIQTHDFEWEKDAIGQVAGNRKNNEVIIRHYKKLISEEQDPTKRGRLRDKVQHMEECNSVWLMDTYETEKIKDFIRTFRCKDKFCGNCKTVKSAERMARYIPEIERLSETFVMHHMVLTVPNVDGHELKETIDKMFDGFARLIRYLKGTKKIRGISFSLWGYVGAIRSLEVSYHDDEYHPHIHSLLATQADFLGSKKHENKYSRDWKKGRKKRLFSVEEILLQKIWYLIINGDEVNKANIEALNVGYSCMIDRFKPGDYHELFKYMVKPPDNAKEMTYEQFRTLYDALFYRQQIQGYGCFRGFNDSDDVSEMVEEMYANWIAELKKKESPVSTRDAPEDLAKDEKYTIVSKHKIRRHLIDVLQKQKQEEENT